MQQSSHLVKSSANSTIRLLALDIDGTIAGLNNEINPPVLEAIRAAQVKGIQVAIATGRMFRSALRFHQAIGSTLPLITYQGALIKDVSTAKVLRHWPLSIETALKLLEYFDQTEFRQELSLHLYIDDRLYVREITPETALYCERSGVEAIAVSDLRRALEIDTPTKILALSEDTDLIDRLLSNLRQHYTPAELYFTKSVATFFEAANPLVNKGTAVKYLAEEILGLKAENVMAIGDNFNDVEMIEYAGIGVAMGNSPIEVQTYANWVAPDVEKSGVARAIEQFLL
ncbi:HAD family phosphatase [Microcoleus sp. FACHB-1515]|uniref:Cof-type HAD-IIB family hydrolase n=1 Tax=Cyanophyceae TaxID=3028117 RepID=UPI001689A975|nr:Cof-type HAD-IIB family hydrolase [Microcoleus sp. FACHB-1515]MBD2091205.1 HAD family phosphatase [Microcoleus sp. FACHB-1515]